MVIVMTLGALLGLGVVLLGVSLWGTPAPSLATQLSRVEAAVARPVLAPPVPQEESTLRGRWAAGTLRRAPWLGKIGNKCLESDLSLLGQNVHAYQIRKVSLAVTVLLAGGPVLLLLSGLTGSSLVGSGALVFLLTGLALYLPDRRVRRRAVVARAAFIHSYAVYLELVAQRTSAASGIHEALRDAAAIGDGPAWARLRRALDSAQLQSTSPAEGLVRLGTALAMPELMELGAQLYVIQDSGAQAEETLRSKARALRSKLQTDAAAGAAARHSSMFLGQMLLVVGLLILLGWAALRSMYGYLPG